MTSVVIQKRVKKLIVQFKINPDLRIQSFFSVKINQ